MASEFICEFCNSAFSKKYNLSVHQKKAKKCLLIQNKTNNENNYQCTKCLKSFTSKQRLESHCEKCNVQFGTEYLELMKKYDLLQQTTQKEIKDLHKQIRELHKSKQKLENENEKLQDRICKIAEIGAKKDTYRINNNIVNQLVPYDLSRDKIRMIVDEKFDENYLYARENGIANFAVNNLLKDNEGNLKMTCTDTSRKTFIYKDEEGNVYKDPNGIGFTDMYIPEVKRKSYEIISDKDDNTDVLELTECITSIDPNTVTNKIAGKLVSKPN